MSRLILGHTTDTSIRIWVRASDRWPFGFVDVLDGTGASMGPTRTLATKGSEFWTAVADWQGLQPSTPYRVKVAFAKTPKAKPDERIRESYTEGNFTTFPPPDSSSDFTFVLGSCNLHSLGIFEKPDDAWIEISKAAKNNRAVFMIHCGDQIYADIPLPPVASLEHYRDKYLDAWDDCKPAKRVLTELPHYMILDDHEIRNDFDNADQNKTNTSRTLIDVAMKVYWEFQHSHNPQRVKDAYHYHYSFNYGTARFFVMDTRYYRDSSNGQMLDEFQEKELLTWIRANAKELKFIATSVPFVGQVRSPRNDKWCSEAYIEQRSRILKCIIQHDKGGVVFMTGDMHNSYHATMQASFNGKTRLIHELMSSPINQITPDRVVSKEYVPHYQGTVDDVSIDVAIDDSSYYGKHSSAMLVHVQSQTSTVSYQIFRTSKSALGPSGSFGVA